VCSEPKAPNISKSEIVEASHYGGGGRTKKGLGEGTGEQGLLATSSWSFPRSLGFSFGGKMGAGRDDSTHISNAAAFHMHHGVIRLHEEKKNSFITILAEREVLPCRIEIVPPWKHP
jgi:hypothetical protein